MKQLTNKEIAMIKAIADAIVEAIKEAGPLGAPGGAIYAAMTAQGITLVQYEQLMAALVATGKVRRQGHLYFASTQQ
jgi:hypothetical protein